MAEVDSRENSTSEGISSETDISDRQLYLLGCVFFASPRFGDGPYEYEFNHDLRLRHQETEASTLLISIAAAIRRRSES